MRLRPTSVFFPAIAGRRSGFTLIEILVAITLTFILMASVVTVFGGVGEGIAQSRRALEQFDRLRTASQQLRIDLQGATVSNVAGVEMRPEESQGYFEVVAGTQPQAVNTETSSKSPDSTAGPRGYFVEFTSRNPDRQFTGLYQGTIIQSDVAEVVWFLRGKTLHRRVLLVTPGLATGLAGAAKATFYANNDISAHISNGQIVPNSLADLTKRENRYAPSGLYVSLRRQGLGMPGASHVGRMLIADLDGRLGQRFHAPAQRNTERAPGRSVGQLDGQCGLPECRQTPAQRGPGDGRHAAGRRRGVEQRDRL